MLFSLVTATRPKRMAWRLEIRKSLFPERVVRHWNRLLRAVVMVPSLLEFEEHLDNTLRYIV